jgi:hypothetical protein
MVFRIFLLLLPSPSVPVYRPVEYEESDATDDDGATAAEVVLINEDSGKSTSSPTIPWILEKKVPSTRGGP